MAPSALGCTVVPMSGGQTEKQVQLICDLEPQIIMVTPSYMQVLIEELVRRGWTRSRLSLEIGIFGAEPWTEAMRREIEQRRPESTRSTSTVCPK